MSKTLPDFVSDEPVSTPAAEQAAAPAEAPAAPVEAVAETPQPAETEAKGQPRGPDGKFATATPPAEAAPAAQPAPEAPPATPVVAATAAPQEPPPVPLATFLDMRDKLTAAEREAKELREWRQQQEAVARRQPAPSFADNPAAAVAHQQQQFQAALFEQRRDFSRQVAEIRHGKETVDAAFNWAADLIDRQLAQTGRSALNDDIRSSPDPMSFVVEQFRRDQIASKVDPSEFEAYLAWKAAQGASPPAPASAQAQPSAQPAAVAPPAAIPAQPAAPRQSLASAPSAATSGAPIPRDGASTYNALFGT